MGKFNRKPTNESSSNNLSQSASSFERADLITQLKELVLSPHTAADFISKIEKSELEVDALANYMETPTKLGVKVMTETPLLLEALAKTRQSRSLQSRLSFIQLYRNVSAWLDESVIENLVRSKRIIEYICTSIIEDAHVVSHAQPASSSSSSSPLIAIIEAELSLLVDLREAFEPAGEILVAGFAGVIQQIALNPKLPPNVRIAACKSILDLITIPHDSFNLSNDLLSNPELASHLIALTGRVPVETLSILPNPLTDLKAAIEAIVRVKPTDNELKSNDAMLLKEAERSLDIWRARMRALQFTLDRLDVTLDDMIPDNDEDNFDELPFKVAKIQLLNLSEQTVSSIYNLLQIIPSACDPVSLTACISQNLPDIIWDDMSMLFDLLSKAVHVCGHLLRIQSVPLTLQLNHIILQAIPRVLESAAIVNEAVTDLVEELGLYALISSVQKTINDPASIVIAWRPVFALPSTSFEAAQVYAILIIRSCPSELLLSADCARGVMDILSIPSFSPNVVAAAMDLFFDVFGSDMFDQILQEKQWLQVLRGVLTNLKDDEDDERISATIENTKAFIAYKKH